MNYKEAKEIVSKLECGDSLIAPREEPDQEMKDTTKITILCGQKVIYGADKDGLPFCHAVNPISHCPKRIPLI